MTQLMQEERVLIAENPLCEFLNKLLNKARDELRNALHGEEPDTHHDVEPGEDVAEKRTTPDHQADSIADVPRVPKVLARAFARVLQLLVASDVAMNLASRTGKESLAFDLTFIIARLVKGDLEYEHFRPLSQLVINRAPELDIWDAAITLVRAISPTPPPSLSVSFDGIGSEERGRVDECRIFEEISSCTYRGVEGFHAKYFENTDWNKRAQDVWDAVKSRHNGERWKDLPETPTEDEVLGWWFELQEKFLQSTRGAYHTRSFQDMLGDKAKRQHDLFVKVRGRAADLQHHWKDVAVIGELKQSKNDWQTTLQVGRYVRDIFAHQPTRRFVHAFALCGTELETWIFDRSGPYSAAIFDIHTEPENFIKVFCGYVMMSDQDLGLDTFIERKNGRLFVTIPADDGSSKKRTLELGPEPLAYRHAIVCSGTSCYPAKAARTDDFDSVVKFSWTSDNRLREAELLQKANDRGVQGLAKLVAHGQITTIGALRDGLKFSEPHQFPVQVRSAYRIFSHSQLISCSVDYLQTSKRSRSNSQQAECAVQAAEGASLVQRSQEPFDNRILRVLAISPAGRALSQFASIAELLGGLRDAIKAHQSLYTKGRILHRDISVNNIILTDSGGMLIDLDLAEEIDEGSSGARRTGTMEFMAIEVLKGISHTYRHDLEAFFYVLIWLCAGRGWHLSGNPKMQPKSMLEMWRTGSYDQVVSYKRAHMDKGMFEDILKEFPPVFDGVKALCRNIRDILFPYDHGLFIGTPKNPEVLYDPIIKAFDDALETHATTRKSRLLFLA